MAASYHLFDRHIHIIGLSKLVLDCKEEALNATPVVLCHLIVGHSSDLN